MFLLVILNKIRFRMLSDVTLLNMEIPVLSTLNLFRIWKGKQSLEVFTLQQHDYGFIGGGLIHGNNFNIRYKVHTDLNWRILQVSIEEVKRPWLSLKISRGLDDLWYNRFGIELTALAGCQELDISVTPFTNSIAVQKISNEMQRRSKAIHIRIPEFDFEVVEQVYTPLGLGRVKYENLTSKFSAELLVDEFGLIADYPGQFGTLSIKK